MSLDEVNLNHLTNQHLAHSQQSEDNDLFIEKYLSYVESIASKIIKTQKIPPCIDFGDLVSWGIEGLIKAKSKFNENSNTKFETYAYYRIRGEILDSIRKEWKYRMPKDFDNSKSELRNQLSNFVVDQLNELSSSPDADPNISDNLIENTAIATFLSYDLSSATSTAKGTTNPETEQIDENFQEIWDEISNLSVEEKQIIDLIYSQGLKQTEIADHLNCSTAKISRIHYKIIEKLKVKLKKRSMSNDF